MIDPDLEFLAQQKEVVQHLRHAIENDRLGHALLFVGPQGSGKSTIALFLAQNLLCPQGRATPELRGCGICQVCKRVWQKSHPDLFWTLSEAKQSNPQIEGNKKPSTEIKISQIRDLRRELAQSAHEGQRRIAVISEAHRLTKEASNALLKTLEEPRRNTHIILLAPSQEILLPTLRSRSQVICFRPLSSKMVQAILMQEGLTAEQALQRSLNSEGSLSHARQITPLSPNQTRVLMDLLQGSRSYRVRQIANIGKDREELSHFLEGFLHILSQEIAQNGESHWLPKNHRHRLLNIIEDTITARNKLIAYGNAQLIMEKLFLNDIPIFVSSSTGIPLYKG